MRIYPLVQTSQFARTRVSRVQPLVDGAQKLQHVQPPYYNHRLYHVASTCPYLTELYT